jgi:hypothetical protein
VGSKTPRERLPERLEGGVVNSSQRNAKTMLGLGIVDLQFEHNRGTTSIYLLTLLGGENLRVEVPVFGSTDTTVLRKAAEILKDRPVRYE